MAHLSFSEVIDLLAKKIGDQFSEDIGSIYYGDVGVYPPKAFQDTAGRRRKAVLVFSPDYIHKDTRSPHAEIRVYGIHVIVMVDMVPYFEALPTEAFGERQLVDLTTRIEGYLIQDENFDFNRRVLSTKVGDVKWNWMQRKNAAIRAAAIEYEVKVQVSRL